MFDINKVFFFVRKLFIKIIYLCFFKRLNYIYLKLFTNKNNWVLLTKDNDIDFFSNKVDGFIIKTISNNFKYPKYISNNKIFPILERRKIIFEFDVKLADMPRNNNLFIQILFFNQLKEYLFSREASVFNGDEFANNNSKSKIYSQLKNKKDKFLKNSIINNFKHISFNINDFLNKSNMPSYILINFLIPKDFNANLLVKNIKISDIKN